MTSTRIDQQQRQPVAQATCMRPVFEKEKNSLFIQGNIFARNAQRKVNSYIYLYLEIPSASFAHQTFKTLFHDY